jgi:LysM repeat protein
MKRSVKVHNNRKETELQKIQEKTKYYVAKYIQGNELPDYEVFVGESLESANNYARSSKCCRAPRELGSVQEFPTLYAAMMYVAEVQAQEKKNRDSGQEK